MSQTMILVLKTRTTPTYNHQSTGVALRTLVDVAALVMSSGFCSSMVVLGCSATPTLILLANSRVFLIELGGDDGRTIDHMDMILTVIDKLDH